MDITSSASDLPIWVIVLALGISLLISVIPAILNIKATNRIDKGKADKQDITDITNKVLLLDKRLRKCERVRDFLLEHSAKDVKTELEIYLKLTDE